MRNTTDPDEIVRARLRAVLADEVRDEPSAGEPTSPAEARISPPWAPQPADGHWADDDWPPSADRIGPSSAAPALRSADYAPPSGDHPASTGDPPSVSLAGAFGSADTRSRRLIPFDPGRRGVRALAAVAVLVVLARKVVDGELILVGVTAPPGANPANGPAGLPAAGGVPAGGPINLNTATLAELDSLPGVGPVLAQRILDAREAQGGFKSVSDLRKVDGIGDSRYEQLKDLVVV